MKRVLSLLLLIPFLAVQAWAWRGGPYDSMVSRAAYEGTYGVAFTGAATVAATDPDQFLKNANGQSAVGVMTMSIPSAGLASGRVLIFNAGMIYLGNAQGTVNAGNMSEPGKAKMTMLQQVSHYTARNEFGIIDGEIAAKGTVGVDLILSGPLNLELSVNYQTGLIEVSGKGKLYKYSPLVSSLTSDSSTGNTVTNETTSQVVQTSVTTTTSTTSTGPDGALTTTNETTTTAGPSSARTTTGNSTTNSSTLNYQPDKVRQAPVTDSEVFMTLVADGVRENTTATALAAFTPPSEQTFFQIDIPAPAGNGAGNGTGTTAATQ